MCSNMRDVHITPVFAIRCSFDFTGESKKYYALISDESFAVNAQFDNAYTTGLTIDPDTLQSAPMRQQGTVCPLRVFIYASTLRPYD